MDRNQYRSYLRIPEPEPLMSEWWRPREVKKSGSNLLYRTTEPISPVPDRKTLREKVLMGFVRLEFASDEAILEFAQQWGVLGICRHGRPSNHQIQQYIQDNDLGDGYHPKFLLETNCAMLSSETEFGWCVETFAQWRDYAAQFGAILKLSALCRNEIPTPIERRQSFEITSEKPGSPDDWIKAKRDWQLDNPGADLRSTEPVWGGRWTLSQVISHWMRVNNIRPVLIWNRNAPAIRLSGNIWSADYLLPVLAVQMMLAASNSVDLSLCAGCSEPFLLGRGQSLHRNSYCIECRRLRVPQQRARQTYYHEEHKSPNRKKRTALTEKQVSFIKRSLQKKKPETVEKLAEKYGVTKWAIYKIAQGKSWGSTK